ncbi:MAG: MerR family transcriptional regulator [Clostridiales bacterium]|nr:MerR family transcriptional regulator [Clostridiales bacterium]
MKIKEVESLLNLSRDNIRFYEKQGLLSPKRGSNQYRDYTEEDIKRLKQIIVLRKCGVPIADIKQLLHGDAQLPEVLEAQSRQLQAQVDELRGALRLCNQMAAEETSLEGLDEERYFAQITQEEAQGIPFADLCNDFLQHEYNLLEWAMRIHFIDIRDVKQRHGVIGVAVILMLSCAVRGLAYQFLWHYGSFWEGFGGPFLTFFLASVLLFPMFALQYRHPVAAKRYGAAVVVLAALFLGAVLLFLAGLLLNAVFHFWF